MTIPSELTSLVERINRELDNIEQNATAGLSIARGGLERFPNNFILIQLFSFLNTSIFFVETSRKRIQARVEYLSTKDIITEEDLQEAGEDLAMELGRALEIKIEVSSIKNRLDNLP